MEQIKQQMRARNSGMEPLIPSKYRNEQALAEKVLSYFPPDSGSEAAGQQQSEQAAAAVDTNLPDYAKKFAACAAILGREIDPRCVNVAMPLDEALVSLMELDTQEMQDHLNAMRRIRIRRDVSNLLMKRTPALNSVFHIARDYWANLLERIESEEEVTVSTT